MVTLNTRDSNQFVHFFSGDIVQIIEQAIRSCWLPANASLFEIVESGHANKHVRSILKGKCKFRLGVEQHVTLDEEKI